MLMTQTEMNSFLHQINQAFQDQFSRLDQLESRLADLEALMSDLRQKEDSNAKQKGPKTSTGRSKRVQQAEADT